jgi:hypothetical protein
MKNDINKDLQGQDYTDKAFCLDKIIDKGHGAAFYILLIVTCLGCYGLLWAILALPYLIG